VLIACGGGRNPVCNIPLDRKGGEQKEHKLVKKVYMKNGRKVNEA